MTATVLTAPLGRRAARRLETTVRLRQAAFELMSAQGVDATTVQQITDAAGVGFGTFYNYADSKEALASDVLDCVIRNLGERNDLITRSLGESDPVRIVANSVRFVLREFTGDPLLHWWMTRIEVLVERSRIGFGPFGRRDIEAAVAAGRYQLIDGDVDLAWSQLCWLMVAAASDIVNGTLPPRSEAGATEGILRIMGVGHDDAHAACSGDMPIAPELPIDFSIDVVDATP